MPTLDAAASMLPIDQAINATGTVGVVAEGAAMTLDVADHLQGRSGRRSVLGRLIRGGDNSNKPTATPHPFEPRRTGQAVEPAGPSVRFAAHHFKDSVPNLPATTPDNRDRSKGVTPPETVEFSRELVDGFRGFTESYVKRLIDLENRTISGTQERVYDRMKQLQRTSGQNYAEDDFMLDVFAPTNPQTGIRTLKSATEINALIAGHPQMIQSLMIVAERYARDALATAGLRAEMRAEGHRTNPDDLDRVIDFPIDQGPLNAGVRRVIDWLRTPANANGRGGPGLRRWQSLLRTTAAVGVATGIGGEPLGVIGVASVPVALGARWLTHNGVRLALVRDTGVLAQAQTEGEQMRGSYLIGVNSQNPLESTRLGNAVQEAIQIVYMRAEYMRVLGVPPQNLDALSEQFLNVHNQRPEETDDSMRNEVMHRFEELGGRTTGITLEQQRNIFRRAQEQAIVHRFEQLRTKPIINESERLTQAIAARQVGEGGEEGAILVARKRDATERKQRLTEDRTDLEDKVTLLTAYQQKLETARSAQQAVDGFISEITRTGTVTPPANFDEAIIRLRETLNIPGTAATMVPDENGRLVPVPALVDKELQVSQAKAAEITAIPVPPGGPTDPAYIARVEGVNRAYVSREQDVAGLRTIVQGAIRRLQNLERTAANARQEALNSQETTSASTTLTEFDQAFARLQPAITAAAATPTGATYDSVMQEANNANLWPPEDNYLPENRNLVRQALAQRKTTNNMQANIANYVTLDASYRAIVLNPNPAQRISAEQLRALSLEELGRRANQLGIPPGAGRDLALQQAQQLATLQLEYLQRAIQEENRIIQDQETVLDRRIRRVNPENEIAQLNMVLEMNNGRDRIYERANQAWMTPEQRTRLEDITHLNPATARTEGYTEAEANSGLPRNALEILNLLTGYQDNPDRNGKFQQIWTNLGADPALLIRILNSAFEGRLVPPAVLPLGVPAPAPIDEFSTRFRESVQAHAITAASFGRGASRMIDGFNAWSKTI